MTSKKIQKNTKKKLSKIINVKNETEAKQLVRNLRKEGNNPRTILKIKIMIDGEKFPLNITKIKDICEGSEQKSKEKIKLTEADYFQLFQKNYTPNDVVSKHGCSFDDVDKAFNNFQKYSDKILSSSRDYEIMISNLRKIYPNVETFEDANLAIETAVESHLMLQSYNYGCSVCEERRVIGEDERSPILQYLKDQKFGHAACRNKPQPEPLRIDLLKYTLNHS